MAGAKFQQIVDLEEWNQMMKESSKNEMIYVLDVYKDWCGPCTVMRFFFDQLVGNSLSATCIWKVPRNIYVNFQCR